jgi:aryl-alcohol dehydrogenase-like predicted oxidoreductase
MTVAKHSPLLTHRLDPRTTVNRVGYGAMQLAGPNVWGPPADPESAKAVLRTAVDLGVTFFDTANAYGPRTVNRLIAEALRPYPETLVIGNKVGATRGPDGSWITANRPEQLREQVHEALVDLGTETSELTYLRLGGDGQAVPSGVPLEESLGALAELREQGLIRRIGLSGATPGQLARAQAITPIAAVQNRYNLLDRSGVEVMDDCEAQGIAFVPYWPLAFGRLAAHEALQAPARRLGATPAQVALAWLLRRSAVMVIIPGTASIGHLRDNLAADRVAQELTEAEATALTNLVDESQARIDRPDQSTVDALTRLKESRRRTA